MKNCSCKIYSSTNFRHCMAKLHDFRASHKVNFRKIIDITYATCVENQLKKNKDEQLDNFLPFRNDRY